MYHVSAGVPSSGSSLFLGPFLGNPATRSEPFFVEGQGSRRVCLSFAFHSDACRHILLIKGLVLEQDTPQREFPQTLFPMEGYQATASFGHKHRPLGGRVFPMSLFSARFGINTSNEETPLSSIHVHTALELRPELTEQAAAQLSPQKIVSSYLFTVVGRGLWGLVCWCYFSCWGYAIHIISTTAEAFCRTLILEADDKVQV